MSPGEWAGFGAGVIAVLSGGLIGLRFLVKGWLNELRPNGGSSVKDKINLLEEKVELLTDLVKELIKR